MSETEQTPKQSPTPHRGAGLHVLVQIVAATVILVVVNVIGFEYYIRKDFSRSQKFVLSQQTRQVLKQVKKPLKVIVYFSPTSMTRDVALENDVRNFLREIQFSLRKNMEMEYVDRARDLNRALELEAQYKFASNDNVVILDYDGQTQFIPVSRMALWDQTPVLAGDPPRIVAFTGEQELTSALINILKPDDRKVYFLTGHGELDVAASAELSFLRESITRQSIKAETLNLQKAEEFPKDAGAIVIAGAQYDPTDDELQALQHYWEKSGSLLVYLDPNGKTAKLRAFLEAHGIKPLDNRVLTLQQISPGLIGVVRETDGYFLADTPVTKRLEGTNTFFAGTTQSLEPQQRKAADANITLKPLVMANPIFWGETQYVFDEKTGTKYDEGIDAKPAIIAALAEKGGVNDENVTLRSSKLIIIGNKDCLLNQAMNYTNLDFFFNSLNWMLDRGKLSGIAPRNILPFYLILNDPQMSALALYTMIIIPGAVALLGVIAWWRRRR